MKREIKFRVWDKLSKEMILPDEIWFKPKSSDLCSKWVAIHRVKGIAFSDTDSCNGELMQYTGLKDKNGKEIYEGDVIEYIGKIGVVFFKTKGSVGFCLNVKKEGIYGLNSNDKYKIIGNIHQNKDLIK